MRIVLLPIILKPTNRPFSLRKGIFDIKDAINLVAERLDISRHTVYLYIRQIKQEQE